MHQEETLQQLPIGYPRGVKGDSDCLGMPRVPFANLSVGGVLCPALLVAALGRDDPWRLLESVLDAPEAAARKVPNGPIA